MENFKDFIIRLTHNYTYPKISDILSKIFVSILFVCLILLFFLSKFYKIIFIIELISMSMLFIKNLLDSFRYQKIEIIKKNSILLVILANKTFWFLVFYVLWVILFYLSNNDIFNFIITVIYLTFLMFLSDKITDFFDKKLFK